MNKCIILLILIIIFVILLINKNYFKEHFEMRYEDNLIFKNLNNDFKVNDIIKSIEYEPKDLKNIKLTIKINFTKNNIEFLKKSNNYYKSYNQKNNNVDLFLFVSFKYFIKENYKDKTYQPISQPISNVKFDDIENGVTFEIDFDTTKIFNFIHILIYLDRWYPSLGNWFVINDYNNYIYNKVNNTIDEYKNLQMTDLSDKFTLNDLNLEIDMSPIYIDLVELKIKIKLNPNIILHIKKAHKNYNKKFNNSDLTLKLKYKILNVETYIEKTININNIDNYEFIFNIDKYNINNTFVIQSFNFFLGGWDDGRKYNWFLIPNKDLVGFTPKLKKSIKDFKVRFGGSINKMNNLNEAITKINKEQKLEFKSDSNTHSSSVNNNNSKKDKEYINNFNIIFSNYKEDNVNNIITYDCKFIIVLDKKLQKTLSVINQDENIDLTVKIVGKIFNEKIDQNISENFNKKIDQNISENFNNKIEITIKNFEKTTTFNKEDYLNLIVNDNTINIIDGYKHNTTVNAAIEKAIKISSTPKYIATGQ